MTSQEKLEAWIVKAERRRWCADNIAAFDEINSDLARALRLLRAAIEDNHDLQSVAPVVFQTNLEKAIEAEFFKEQP